MKVKFNKFERIAGLFVLTAIGGTLVAGAVIAVKKGWFERKVELKTKFETASGLNPGTQVQMSGLRIGSVDSVELVADNEVIVTFTIPHKHLLKIRKNSHAQTIRPFLIGDKVLEITVGTADSPQLEPGEFVSSTASTDLMDLLGGRKLGAFLEEMGSIMGSMKTIIKAFGEERRAENVIRVFDEVLPLFKNVNSMANEVTELGKQANHNKNMKKMVENVVLATDQINKALPEIVSVVQTSPHLAKDMVSIVENLSKLTAEMTQILPAFSQVAPEIPLATKRAIEAMDEAVVVLKAMQKSFLLKGSVEEVREEEEKRKREGERLPASE